MDPSDPASSTPKRKRSLPAIIVNKHSPSQVNTHISVPPISAEDAACGSPRTKVAYRFQGLGLEGGSISTLDLKTSTSSAVAITEQPPTRKRLKFIDVDETEIPETPEVDRTAFSSDRIEDPTTNNFNMSDEAGPVIFKGLGAHARSSAATLQRAYPSINRLADSKSRGRKGMGTPPIAVAIDVPVDDTEDIIVDPDRAALTWHDDEITGHNPSDPEDDGEGINGIGFKPTPAEARARTERRRQQMADYRSREMKEARAKRSERRRNGSSLSAGSKDDVARRVRFSESEAHVMITT
jgi:hypothetical protein